MCLRTQTCAVQGKWGRRLYATLGIACNYWQTSLGEDRIFTGCFSLHRGITAVATQKKTCPHVFPLLGDFSATNSQGRYSHRKGTKPERLQQQDWLTSAWLLMLLDSPPNSPSSRNINPKPSLTASIFQQWCTLRLGKTPVINGSCTERDCRVLAALRLKNTFPQMKGKRICLFVLGIVLPNPKHKLNIHEPPIWIGYLLKANTKSPFCMRCPGTGQSQVSALAVGFPGTLCAALNQLLLPIKTGSKLNKEKKILPELFEAAAASSDFYISWPNMTPRLPHCLDGKPEGKVTWFLL